MCVCVCMVCANEGLRQPEELFQEGCVCVCVCVCVRERERERDRERQRDRETQREID